MTSASRASRRHREYVLVFAAPIFERGAVKGVLAGAIYLDTRTTFDALPPLDTSRQTVTVVDDGAELHGGNRRFESSVEASRPSNRRGGR
ncbi:hypothetical protein GJ632_21580 [Halogeometricum sp. CBA1124]|nr:hypothetical protein [Halogeometricum sp. CBA1124]